MIDYEKLKLAHELAQDYAEKKDTVTSLSITIRFDSRGAYEYRADFSGTEYHEEIDPTTLDDLLAKLKHITQDKPKPKYELGQAVWFIDFPVNKIYCGCIKKIRHDEYVVVTDTQGPKEDFAEHELYPSKQALIIFQLNYWSDLMRKEKTKALCNDI